MRSGRLDVRYAAHAFCDRVKWLERATIMTKVQALEEEIEKLSSAELVELREWILEREADVWDREIERDAASGKLDKLFEKSVADHLAGKSREI
jgi:hypothetical protein